MNALILALFALSALPLQAPEDPAAVSPPPTPCRPAPYEDCDEGTFDVGPSRAWGFDDNRFCAVGRGVDCVVPATLENPNPFPPIFVDYEGCIFEMYVVADCGTELHVPLCDVESGTVRVIDPAGQPVYLHAANGVVTGQDCQARLPGDPPPDVPFEAEGLEISWEAEFCDGRGDTGGPGNFTLMDIWFTANDDSLPERSLCGVYTIEFESWAGCGWELFANCNGTNQPNFFIFDDKCQAESFVTPLPELVLDNLTLVPGADPCTVDYCVDVLNIGCVDPLQFDIVVEEAVSGSSETHQLPGLAGGETATVCGTLLVNSSDPLVTVPVRAEVDPADEVAECREIPTASSCNPASGEDEIEDLVDVECNRPPDCDAGGPYVVECIGATTPVGLDGTGSSDPDGDPLTFQWQTDCPGGIADPDTARTVLDFDTAGMGCSRSCTATLSVSDGYFTEVCDAPVTVEDTVPPAFTNVPGDLTVECSQQGGAPAGHPEIVSWRASFRAEDACSSVTERDDMPSFFDAGCAPGEETPVTVTAADECGLEGEATRSVWVEDTTPPVWDVVPDDLTVECSDKGGTPASDPQIVSWRATFEASDVCGSVTDRDDMPAFFPAACEPGRETPVTVTAVDWCSLETDVERSVFVEDTTPPFFTNVPDELTVECSAPGGTPASDPEIQAWRAEFTGDDVCGGVSDGDDMPDFFPAGCAPGEETPVTVTLTDACALEADETRSVRVQDTTPPEIEAVGFDGACLWPPNHKYVCLEGIDALVTARDICDPDPVARVDGCSSNQPDDARDDLFPGANGDGHTINDCTVGADGQTICMRSERLGTDPAGRTYSPEIGVYDQCSNRSETTAGVHVPHDQSPSRKDCLSPDSPGMR